MDQFPSNSHRPSPERKESPSPDNKDKSLEPIVTGKVVRRKKSLGRRIKEMFFSGDTDSVVGYLVRDVLIPAVQATVTDMITQGVEKAVYGNARSPRTRPTPGRTHISYDRYGSSRPSPVAGRTPTTPSDRRPARPSAFQLGEVILENRIEADAVAEKMYEIVQEYGVATVGDLNSLIGQTSSYTDHKWGWDNLHGLDIRRVREGYLLILPEPEDLR